MLSFNIVRAKYDWKSIPKLEMKSIPIHSIDTQRGSARSETAERGKKTKLTRIVSIIGVMVEDIMVVHGRKIMCKMQTQTSELDSGICACAYERIIYINVDIHMHTYTHTHTHITQYAMMEYGNAVHNIWEKERESEQEREIFRLFSVDRFIAFWKLSRNICSTQISGVGKMVRALWRD